MRHNAMKYINNSDPSFLYIKSFYFISHLPFYGKTRQHPINNSYSSYKAVIS